MHTLRLFCDVARHHSFSAAASDHGITQSAVSQRISQLEKKLGVPLLDRSVRPLELTEAGVVYLRGCLELVQRYEHLESRVCQLRQLEGCLRVDAIYSAGIDLLYDICEAFEASHPQVSVKIDYKRPDAIYEEVRKRRCDIGIVSFPQAWRDVAVIPLRDERMVVVCQPHHPLAQQPTVSAEQLAPWPMFGFEKQLPVARHIRKYLKTHGVRLSVHSEFDNIDTIKSAVAVSGWSPGNGNGNRSAISILPRRTVQREVAAETLATVELCPRLQRPMGIIHPRHAGASQTFSPVVQAFIDLLVKKAGPHVDSPDADKTAQLSDQESQTLIGQHI